jgi:cob(I)alamin adenosyltransferase
MTRFYTQTGDDGYTGLLGEGRAQKYDPRIETVGAIDEANAALGLARAFCQTPQASSILLVVQRDLYHLMAEIAATPENAARFRSITDERVTWLEAQIDEINQVVTVPDEFIIPGDTKAGAVIDLARTIVRRAERQVAFLFHQGKIENRELLRYMNRLSSLCFILELLENQAAGNSQLTLAQE